MKRLLAKYNPSLQIGNFVFQIFKRRMTLFFKILLIFLLLILGVRYITKPFRDILKQTVKFREKVEKQKRENNNKTSKTDDLGEYIDYEEIE